MTEYKSVNKIFEESFRKNWDREALSNYQGETLRYSDLARRIRLIHITYGKYGLKKGDKVALCSRNQTNWAVSFLAALTYGAVPVPLLHEFKSGNIHYLVNHCEAKLLFVDDVIWDGLNEAEMPALRAIYQMNNLKCLVARDSALNAISTEGLDIDTEHLPEDFGPEDISYCEDSPEELALINYTSGTSGFSKGVMLPYRALSTNILFAQRVEPQVGGGSQIVSMLPSAHMYGMMFEFLFFISVGGHVHFLTRVPSPKIIMKAFSEIHPALVIAVPLIIEKVYKSQIKPIVEKNRTLLGLPLVRSVIRRKFRSSLIEAFGGNFEEVILGGAAFNPEIEDFFRSIRFPFTVGYGMTECAPIITYVKWNKTRKGSCGRPIEGCHIRIDSPDPLNVPGEIQVSGSNVFLGYYRNEEATSDAFTDDGWFRTGDMGVVDKDGYLYLRGRSKCMILGPSGQNIYPEELEAVVNNFPYVVDSLVIEDKGNIVSLVYPDYHLAELDGKDPENLALYFDSILPQINKLIPNYAQIKRIELMAEDFERTPKHSIKRYLYKRG